GDSPKGNILSIAEVAGIMAAKNTSSLLPLCHPLILDSVRIWFDLDVEQVHANCEVVCHAKTGVEMEALVGLNICLLTIYDLAKAVDPVIELSDIHLQTKEGGKSGVWNHPKKAAITDLSTQASVDVSFRNLKFAVGALSDRASQGVYQDESGALLRNFCNDRDGIEKFYKVIPDEKEALLGLVREAAEDKVDVLLLTGGTGISERDITPDTVKELSSKELIGFGELQRQFGSRYTKASWLSRSSAYVVNETLVILFPGNPKAVKQGLECVGSLIPHAIRMLRGESHHENLNGGKR
ncbi:MAG: bifunctional molybdenum cofactor biosynthesis protein MoaC/MoaB, partial [Bdellovibrionaceae bacterium]|nr:bifunctional molybdenum cofactor biosynthesis protein MoaC/MoaB [Pseudobdellovibrionaceae bacterium]